MKRVLTVLFLVCLLSGQWVWAQDKKAVQTKPAAPAKPVMVFEEDTFDFGLLKEGAPAVHVFKFKNTGNAPLIITKAEKSCGCTTPEWPTEPIKPGGTGTIRVAYDTKGRTGYFMKPVYVYTNAPQAPAILIIKGEVEMPPQPDPNKIEVPVH